MTTYNSQTSTTMTTNHPILYRQGDVLLERVDSIPASAKHEHVKDRAILAYGEVTGHHHSFKAKSAKLYREPDTQATYIEIAEALADLEHQEHETIRIPEGRYKVTIQREYHPEAIRSVAD